MQLLTVTPAPPGQRKYVREPRGVHEGVGCDRTGVTPIVGVRYTLTGRDYDLCEAEFDKLPEEQRRRFTRVEPTTFYARVGLPGEATAVPIRAELPPE